MTRKILAAFAAAASLVLFGPAARAAVLTPGTIFPPDTLTLGAGATSVAFTSGSFTSSAGASDFTGTFQERVFSDPTNTFGAGDLTWLIQVTNNGPSPLAFVTSASFLGFQTDVGQNLAFSSLLDERPTFVSRDLSFGGQFIAFRWGFPGLDRFFPSSVLEIETDATSFTTGRLIEVSNGPGGGVSEESAFAPATIPLPAALPLFATGIGALGLLGWHRKRKARVPGGCVRANECNSWMHSSSMISELKTIGSGN
jgi:hypothetical protein